LDDRRESGVDCDCAWTGPVSPDPLIAMGDRFADPSSPAIDDRIELTRFLGFRGEEETQWPEAPLWRWQPAMSLVGPTNILDQDHVLPGDAATWNSFPAKQLRIGLVGPYYDEAPGYDEWQIIRYESFTAEAAISTFAIVPEPRCLALGLIAAGGCGRNLRIRAGREKKGGCRLPRRRVA
jgi:hypothetical protein